MFGRHTLNDRDHTEYLLLRLNWRSHKLLQASKLSRQLGDRDSHFDERTTQDLEDIQKGSREFLDKFMDKNFDIYTAKQYAILVSRSVDNLYDGLIAGRALFRDWMQRNS